MDFESMATTQRPTTPSFRAVNSADFTPTDLHTRNMATPRTSQITPPAPPAASFDFRTHTAVATPAATKDESPSSQTGYPSGQEDKGEEMHDQDRDSSEPAEKSGASGKSSGRVKKKKGTKFHCTGFGNCTLAFTRSEHLARHIR
jgi:hypothetical protein